MYSKLHSEEIVSGFDRKELRVRGGGGGGGGGEDGRNKHR